AEPSAPVEPFPISDGPLYPGTAAILDGSEAIASVETRISEIACAYPITPSTTMAAIFQAAVADGRPNLWGTRLRFVEPESEHSSASAAEGAALAGARVTNFTAGQGLILMKEVLYVISGKRLPIVFHIGARALTSQALNIHAGHDDVMGVADTGWGMLFARNAQEAADLTAIARRVAEATEVPFFVVQDGFLTTHTMESMRLPEDDLLRAFVGDPRERIRTWFDPEQPLMTGVVQNQDSYMKGRLGQRAFYDRLPGELAAAFDEWAALTGRHHAAIQTYRTEDAAEIVVAMGTIADTATAVVDHLRAEGRPVGCVAVTSFRPFPADELWTALHAARTVAVIERTDDPAAHDNPLTREVKAALFDHAAEGTLVPRVRSVSAGLGSRDVGPGDIAAVFDWIADHRAPADRRYATIGIRHPLALETRPLDLRPKGAFSLRGHSIGGFGSVTTNKLVATLSGELFGKQVQAYPRYGSEKKGLPTTYYLTVARERSRQHGELDRVDFVPLHDVAAFRQGNPLQGLVDGGTVFVSSSEADPDAIWASIPSDARREILERRIRLAALDTAALARTRAPRPDLVLRMQGVALVGAFLRLTPFAADAGLDRETLLAAIRPHLERFFGKRGSRVVDANLDLVAAAYDGVVDVTAAVTAVVPAERHDLFVPEVLS
ncbi:MAG TPA: 2-oxoacid:acceptor oxidoreductase family protein, partial [Candidatus Limnocylindrales bacterium]|nr:2-oxoacid:acceptor oxidoreductase family protein [Candidatus Limnocylindrales bacterium]